MNDEIIALVSLSHDLNNHFNAPNPAEIIADKVDLSRSTTMLLFMDQQDNLFAFITSKAKTTLGDIRKMLLKANLIPIKFFDPKNKPNHFDQIATELFKQAYPGMKPVSNKDLIYYKTLVSCNPALVEIKNIRNGIIKSFDTNAKNNWRPYKKFNYSKVKVELE